MSPPDGAPPQCDARSRAVAACFVDACLLDVAALKPGNVGFHGAGHRMTAVDFVRSARAAAPAIAAAGRTVGERILAAVEATHRAVSTNTNLGIVLLAAPLAHAALSMPRPAPRRAWRAAVRDVLEALTVDDAERAFAAIRLANPGGLGSSPEHDVHARADVTLLEAMRAAADRDTIARQYAHGFADVLATGTSWVEGARARGLAWPAVVTEVFLRYLSRYPDSHVERKLGAAAAMRLQRRAARRMMQRSSARPAFSAASLERWDSELKASGINPGTSADLSVATVFACFLDSVVDSWA